MSDTYLPPAAYYATLPTSITGAGVILHDPAGRVLLVEPAYRTDVGDSRRRTRRRRIPVGRRRPGGPGGTRPHTAPGRLLAVDWMPPQPDGRPALANFMFDGGTITEDQAREKLLLPPGELASWRLAAPDEWPRLLAHTWSAACRPASTP